MALIVALIVSILPLVSGGQDMIVGSETNQEALYKAEDILGKARAVSLLDFSSVRTANYPNQGIYSRDIIVNDVDSLTKEVTSKVSWNAGGQDFTVSLTTLLTNPILGGDTCNSVLTGDWTSPRLLGAVDVSDNNKGTDVDVFSNKAYITTDATSPEKDDFYIVDVSNSNPPPSRYLPILGSINTGPGLAAVHVAGKYAYVANISATNQLQVIDISLPAAPSELAIARRDVTKAGDVAVGSSIFYADKKIYLGLSKSDGPEFYVFDTTDPINPSKVASFETNTKVNAIIIKNGVAYLAVPDNPDTSLINEQLIVLDVSQANLGIITQINAFGPNPITMSGESLYISKGGNTLYFGEGGANPSNDPQFFLLDVSNPYSITVIDSKFIDTANDVSVRAIIAKGNLAFTVNSDPDKDFQVFDLDNLSNSPYQGYLNIEQASVGGMDCEGNLIYVVQRSNKALQIIGPGEY
ncbi:MAG: hypothetical protein AAB340_02190 [Patescibacteria group bacterium]